MRHTSSTTLRIFFSLLLFLGGCVGRSYLIVDYELPTPGRTLAGQTVFVTVKDARADDRVFTPAAAAEFEAFQNRFNLNLVNSQGGRLQAGQYDLKGLFKEAFRKRLEDHGVRVVEERGGYVPVFEIEIKKLTIDLAHRKWVVAVDYEASLSRDSQLIARESVTGGAERLKIIGRKEADRAFSEIFTEIVNRLNIVHLFQQAKLI
jgi:uncharacterized lipoprotein YajG